MSDSQIGALVEVLQDLRQNVAALEALDEVHGDADGTPPPGDAVFRDRLQSRYLATLLPSNPDELVVAIDQGATRSYVESRGLASSIKIGDFIGSDRHLSRATSRLLFDDGNLGLVAPSAEHHPSLTLAAFESHSVSGRVRLGLTAIGVDLALGLGVTLTYAAQYLGLLSPALPSTSASESDEGSRTKASGT